MIHHPAHPPSWSRRKRLLVSPDLFVGMFEDGPGDRCYGVTNGLPAGTRVVAVQRTFEGIEFLLEHDDWEATPEGALHPTIDVVLHAHYDHPACDKDPSGSNS